MRAFSGSRSRTASTSTQRNKSRQCGGRRRAGRPAVLDGEIVVYNEAGQIDFGLLQQRRGRYQTLRSSPRRDEPFDDAPVRFLAFNLLHFGTKSLLREPYEERRGLLAGLVFDLDPDREPRSCTAAGSPNASATSSSTTG